MSLSSMIAEAEVDVAKVNPLAIMKAALAEIENLKTEGAALKTEVEDVKSVLVAAEPALTTLLGVVYPGGAGIPAEILALMNALPKLSASMGANIPAKA